MAALETKPLVAITIVAMTIILLVYISARDTINQVAPIVFWVVIAVIGVVMLIGSAVFIITQYEKLFTLRVQMKSAREIAEAEGIKARAIAKKEEIFVITAGERDQVIIRDDDSKRSYLKMDMIPNARVNGHYEAPTDLEIQLFQRKWSGASEPLVIDQDVVPNMDILDRYNSDWIQTLLESPHVHLCGASGCGKTMLANHILVHIQKTDPQAQFFLLNPKNITSRKPFIIDPTYDDVDQSEEALRHFIAILEKRRHDPNFDKSSNKIIFVIDELDYIKQMKGRDVARLINPLIKMGRELNIKVIIISQSSLSDDTGITQSSFFNLCRVAIGLEGDKLLTGSPISKRSKIPSVAKYEDLRNLSSSYKMQTGNKLRYCMVIPMDGNPSVQVIPHLEDPVVIGQKKLVAPKPVEGSYDEKVCRAWYKIYQGKRPSCNLMHKMVTENNVNVNPRQKDKYEIILKKYGIDPNYF